MTPAGHYLQGRVAMLKDFGPEAQQAVTPTTQASLSNYRIRFIKPDIAVADAMLTVRNVKAPDGKTIPVVPINFFFVAVRHGDKWLYASIPLAHQGKSSNAFSARGNQRTVGLTPTKHRHDVITGVPRSPKLTDSVELKELSATADDIRFLRLPDVKAVTGLSKTSLYALIREQSFPAPVRLGPRAVAWVRSEVNQLAADRVVASRLVGYDGVPKPSGSVRTHLSGRPGGLPRLRIFAAGMSDSSSSGCQNYR